MDMGQKINRLYDKDTSEAFALLRELEALSDESDVLYPYMDAFLSMLQSEKYVIRVRGFRLLCKQAKWDTAQKIDGAINPILAALQDEKPTAVRQMLQYLAVVAACKPQLAGEIRQAALSIDCPAFKDTMRPLIEQDVRHLVQLIDSKA